MLVDIFELLFCSDSGGAAAAASAYGKQLLETSLVYIFTSMNILISAVNEFQRGPGASGMAMVRSSASERQRQQQQQQQQHDFTKMAEDTSAAQVRLRIFQFALQALEIELRRCTSASTGRISLGALFKEHLGTVTGGGGPSVSPGAGAGFALAAARDGADGKSSEHLSVAQISLRLLSASIPGSFAALAQSSVDGWVAELFRKGALTRVTAVFDEVAAAVAHVAGLEHNYSGWTCNLAMDQAGDLLAVKPTPGAPGAVATQAGPPGPVIVGGGGFGWPVPAAPAAGVSHATQ